MPSVATAVNNLITSDPTLNVALHHGLLNLTQVARFIQPLVVARLKREVSVSAILMTLSRLQRAAEGTLDGDVDGGIAIVDRITVHAGLAVLSVPKNQETHKVTQQLFTRLQAQDSYVTVSEGVREIALILEERRLKTVESLLSSKPLQVVRGVAGLSVHIAEAALDRPRVLYTVLQQVALQNISVIEITSTRSEFHLYLADSDVMLAFDSIYSKFTNKVASGRIVPGGSFSLKVGT